MTRLLRIGAFARLARVTVKTLRFYADAGLLAPREIDRSTGYRHYAAEQVAEVTKILNLREAGFSLDEIRALIRPQTPVEEVAAALEGQRRALLAQRALIESRLRVVDALSRSARETAEGRLSEARLKPVDPERAHAVRRKVPHLGAPVTAMFEAAEAMVAKHGARSRRSPFLLFHESRGDTGLDVEACIPLKDDAPDALPSRLVPGIDLACSIVYAGPYSQSDPLRDQMQQWLRSAGLEGRGPWREVYHRFGADEIGYALPKESLARSPRDFVTEIQIDLALTDKPGE